MPCAPILFAVLCAATDGAGIMPQAPGGEGIVVPPAVADPHGTPAAPVSPYQLDAPPPTPYDLQVQSAPLGVLPRTQGLLWYAGRVVLGLLAVIALIYASAKLLLPRLFKQWAIKPGREMEVVERLPLDKHNAVILLRLNSGERLLVGTGERGVAFLTRLAAPEAADFQAAMAITPDVLGPAREAPHAAAH